MHQIPYPKYVVRNLEWIEEGGYIYLISSLMNRGDLASYISSRKLIFLTEEEFKEPVRIITSALESIHKLGFIHNDI